MGRQYRNRHRSFEAVIPLLKTSETAESDAVVAGCGRVMRATEKLADPDILAIAADVEMLTPNRSAELQRSPTSVHLQR